MVMLIIMKMMMMILSKRNVRKSSNVLAGSELYLAFYVLN